MCTFIATSSSAKPQGRPLWRCCPWDLVHPGGLLSKPFPLTLLRIRSRHHLFVGVRQVLQVALHRLLGDSAGTARRSIGRLAERRRATCWRASLFAVPS